MTTTQTEDLVQLRYEDIKTLVPEADNLVQGLLNIATIVNSYYATYRAPRNVFAHAEQIRALGAGVADLAVTAEMCLGDKEADQDTVWLSKNSFEAIQDGLHHLREFKYSGKSQQRVMNDSYLRNKTQFSFAPTGFSQPNEDTKSHPIFQEAVASWEGNFSKIWDFIAAAQKLQPTGHDTLEVEGLTADQG